MIEQSEKKIINWKMTEGDLNKIKEICNYYISCPKGEILRSELFDMAKSIVDMA